LRQGHVVGNHTVRHRLLPTLSPEQLAHEIDHNADLIEEVIGERPHLFRPPYGGYSEDVRRHLVGLRNELWLWSIDPHDYLTWWATPTASRSGSSPTWATTPAAPCSCTTPTPGA
jgi:peptidoglycan/xylan/chitin deacetylase (PgdA/CDA1 family)